MSIIVV